MAKEYVIDIQGQPTRYSDKVRTLPMYFAEPEQGAEGHTGILLWKWQWKQEVRKN